LVSVTGDGVLFAAAPLLAAALTQDRFLVGAITSASFAAWLIGGLPIGVLVDRLPLVRIMITSDIFRVIILAIFTILLINGSESILILGLVMFLLGIGSCFFDPAAQAMLPNSISKGPDELLHTNIRYWLRDSLGRWLLGPPIGATLMSAGRPWPFLVDGMTFVASAALITHLPRKVQERRPRTPLKNDLIEGLRVMREEPQLRSATTGMVMYNLGWSVANATLVLFAKEDLGLTETQFGLVLATTVLGAVLGRVAYRLLLTLNIRHTYALGLFLQAIGWGSVAYTGSVAALILATVLSGAASLAVSAKGGAVRQLRSPPTMRGRVVANTRIVGIGVHSVGSLIGGAVASHCDLRCPLYLTTGIMATTALWFAITNHALKDPH
jgi:MFS family permease